MSNSACLFAIITLLLFSVSFNTSHAQVEEPSAQNADEINSIKLSGECVFAESTMEDWKDAYNNAKLLLALEIELWLKEEKQDTISHGCIVKSMEHICEIKSRRGELFRVFLYVKKSDIFSFTENDKVMMLPLDDNNTPIVKLDHQQEKPVIFSDTFMQDVIHDRVLHITSYKPSAEELEILSVTKFDDIKPFIQGLKTQGILVDYGKYATLPVSGDCYLFIYNRDGDLPGYLHRKNGVFTNIRTGLVELINDYKNFGAIWFQITK